MHGAAYKAWVYREAREASKPHVKKEFGHEKKGYAGHKSEFGAAFFLDAGYIFLLIMIVMNCLRMVKDRAGEGGERGGYDGERVA